MDAGATQVLLIRAVVGQDDRDCADPLAVRLTVVCGGVVNVVGAVGVDLREAGHAQSAQVTSGGAHVIGSDPEPAGMQLSVGDRDRRDHDRRLSDRDGAIILGGVDGAETEPVEVGDPFETVVVAGKLGQHLAPQRVRDVQHGWVRGSWASAAPRADGSGWR